MKSLQVGDLRAEIKILHFLQMGEKRAMMFLLPHAPSTLANCYRMRSVRQQIATVCAVCASKFLPYAQRALANCEHHFTRFYTILRDLLRYAQCALAIGYHMRSVRQQFATVCAVYANKANHMLILPIYLNQVLTNEKSEKSEKAILTP